MRQDQKRIFKLISRAEATDRTLASVRKGTLGREFVAVDQSSGRILAEDITALHDLPPYDRAAMDGYAVRSQDTARASTANPVRLMITGKLFPSDRPSPERIVRGQCVYTATGARLPEGSDAVIEVEKTRLGEGWIEVLEPVRTNECVSIRGEEARQGETLFKRGYVIAPQSIGTLLTLDMRTVKVTRKPRVNVISVGDELAEAYRGSQNKVVNDHAYVISELLRQLGAEPKILGVVPDDPQLIEKRINDALTDADLVITIAGSSVGARDFVPDVVELLGKTVFHGVAMTPGKVTGVGMVDGKPIIMLPGYLMSALAGFYVFVAPLVNRLLNLDHNIGLPVIDAKLRKATRSKHGLERFQLLQLSRDGNSYLATPVEAQFGAVVHLSKANGYTIVPKGQVLKEGERVTVTLFAPSEFRRIPIKTRSEE